MMRILLFFSVVLLTSCGASEVFRPNESPNYAISLKILPTEGITIDSVERCLVRRMETQKLAYSAIRKDTAASTIAIDVIGYPANLEALNTPNLIIEVLTHADKITFWELYRNTDDPMLEVFKKMQATDLTKFMYYNQTAYGSAAIFNVPKQSLDSVTIRLNDPAIRAMFPPDGGLHYAWSPTTSMDERRTYFELFVTRGGVANRPIITVGGIGDGLVGVQLNVGNSTGQPSLDLDFDQDNTRTFAYLTQKMAADNNREIAIIYKNRVLIAPSVRTAIESGHAFISSGSINIHELKHIESLLKMPVLPCPLQVLKFEVLK